jgi:DNA polymerase lambda
VSKSDYDTESEEERDLYHRPAAAGFKCDQVGGEVPPADCPNQKVINVVRSLCSSGALHWLTIVKLEELKGLHAAKRGEEDKWKVFSYTKAISALRTYPKPIRSLSEAKALRGVGEKTAKKVGGPAPPLVFTSAPTYPSYRSWRSWRPAHCAG